MPKKYTRKQIVDKIIKQRKGGKKHNTTYKKINSVGGADPDNFFKGKTFTIDEFLDKACLTFTKDKNDATFLDKDEYIQELKERTTTVSNRLDPAFVEDYERMLNVYQIFDSEETFFQCVRSFIQLEMFIQDDYDEFLKLQNITTNTITMIAKKNGVSDEHIQDNMFGHTARNAFETFFKFIKVLSRKTLVHWINTNMNSRTRLSNRVQIANIMRRLKPDYYLYVMFAREPVRSMLSNPFSKNKDPQYKYVISQNNRKYIYEIMSEYTKITTPDDMYRVLFDFNSFVQINYGENIQSLNDSLNFLSQYEGSKYSSFTTNKWDILIDMASKNLKNYANEVKEVTNSEDDKIKNKRVPRTRYQPNGSLMSLSSLNVIQKSFRGEIISRGGFELFILKGNDATPEYTNSGNDQEVIFRHQKIEPMKLEVLKVFVPEDSPYKGISNDFPLNLADEEALNMVEGKKNYNLSVVIYKYFLYYMALHMKKGETSLTQQQQLGGDKLDNPPDVSLTAEVDNFGELNKPTDTDPLNYDNVTPMTSEKVSENIEDEQIVAPIEKQVPRTEPFIHYEWVSIYARIQEGLDNGLTLEDAIGKEHDIIEKKLQEVYPYRYSFFTEITDENQREEELRKQDQTYFDTYGEFFKAHAVMHAKSTNPPIVLGKDLLTMSNTTTNVMLDNPHMNGIESDQINMNLIGPGGQFNGLLYKFVSAHDIEKVDFDEITTDGNPIYLFVPEVDPKELEKYRFNPPNTIPHIVTTSPTNPIEKAGLEKISTELNDIPENNDSNPFIHEYTKDNYNDLIHIFKERNFHLFSGIEYDANISNSLTTYMDTTIDPSKRDAFFTYKTHEEGNAKYRAFDGISHPRAIVSNDPNFNFLYGTGPTNSYEDRITDTQLDEIMKFLDEQTHGLLTSKTMGGYKNVLRENIKLRKILSFVNPEKGYIYTFSIKDLIFGSSFLSAAQMGVMSKMTVGFFCHFEKINNSYDLENNSVERKNIILWNNPSPAMKQQIMIGAPRMYNGFFKNIWNSLDGKEDPPVAVAVPIEEEEGITPEEKIADVPVVEPLPPQGGEPEPIVSNEDKEETKELSKEKTELGPDAPVPRSISITVTTTIPGHQEFKLEPSDFGIKMGKGGRGTNRKTAMINPQLKLSQKAIDLAGDNKKKQFYDRELFRTLNNRIASEHTFGLTPIPLDVAISKGIVDYNIDLTVKNLLAPNTIIYLGGEPYVIYDTEYDDSSWKLQPKDVVDMRLSMKDVADASVISMQARTGAKELQKLPDELKRGDNNAEPIPLKQRNPEDVQKEKEEEKKEEEAVKPTIVNVNGTVVKKEPDEPALPTPEPSTALIVKPPPIVVPPKKELPELPAPPKPETLPGISSTPIPEVNTNFQQPNAIASEIRNHMAKFFRYGYFNEYYKENEKTGEFTTEIDNYKKLEMLGFTKSKPNICNIIDKLNKLVTGKNMSGGSNEVYKGGLYENVFRLGVNMSKGKNRGQGCVFSSTNYENYIKNLKVLDIAGDGNCFYNCVSTAFNLENAYLLLKSKDNGNDVKDQLLSFDVVDNETQSVVTRKNTEFSPMFIRWSVVNYYRGNKEKLLSEMLRSSNMIFGYQYTYEWANKHHPELLQKSDEIKQLMDLLKEIDNMAKEFGEGGIDNKSINEIYLLKAQELVSNVTLTEEDRHIIAYDVADSLFRQHSYEIKFMGFNRNFPADKPVDQIFPFGCPVDFKEAENILMDPGYYAQATDIEIIQEVFKVKVIALKQDLEENIVQRDGTMIIQKQVGFRIANDFKNEEDREKPVDYNHVIAVSYERESHYNLIAFDASLTKSEIDVKEKAIQKTKNTRRGSIYKKGGKRTRRKRGGADIKSGNYKKAIFPIKKDGITKDFLPNLEFQVMKMRQDNIPFDVDVFNIPSFDDIETSMPFYMYFLMYTSYNQIKERTDDRMFKLFRPFYAEFSVIDTLVSDIIVKKSDKEEFSSLYGLSFNLDFNHSYLIQNEQVEELSDTESVRSDDSADMLGGFSRNVPYQPAPITKDVIDILNDDQSQLTFHLNVHLTLRPGIEINKTDIPALSCETKLQAIKMNLAKILGRPYFPTPRNEERFKRDLEKETKSEDKKDSDDK